jgi:hypothetical protein
MFLVEQMLDEEAPAPSPLRARMVSSFPTLLDAWQMGSQVRQKASCHAQTLRLPVWPTA